MTRKLAFIFSVMMFACPVQANVDDLKSQIHFYLESYKGILSDLHRKPPLADRLRVGEVGKLQGNIAFLHMMEVIDLITEGKLDECCFHSPPATYKQYANATTAEVLRGATIPNPGSEVPFTIPSYLGTQMSQLIDQTTIVAEQLPVGSRGLDAYDVIALQIMVAITQNGSQGNIFNNLVWGWSYIDKQHSSLESSFKDYYIYACVVCDGAGFYDTHDLYNINPKTGNSYYEEIVTAENLPQTWNWLQSLAREQGSRPPLQPSIGLTLQGQAQDTEKKLDPSVIYPTHCHRAQELYFGLDPMQVSKAAASKILSGHNGYDYDTDSYGIGGFNLLNLPIEFRADLSSQFPKDFMTVRNADVIYNESVAYHAFNAGRRFQFTQWSRLTWPQEGTYFPFNGGPQPPSGVTCATKPSGSSVSRQN